MPELKLIASVEVTGRYTGNGDWFDARDRAGDAAHTLLQGIATYSLIYISSPNSVEYSGLGIDLYECHHTPQYFGEVLRGLLYVHGWDNLEIVCGVD